MLITSVINATKVLLASKEISVFNAQQVNIQMRMNNKVNLIKMELFLVLASLVTTICIQPRDQLARKVANKNYLAERKIIRLVLLNVMITLGLNNFIGNNLKFVMKTIKNLSNYQKICLIKSAEVAVEVNFSSLTLTDACSVNKAIIKVLITVKVNIN